MLVVTSSWERNGEMLAKGHKISFIRTTKELMYRMSGNGYVDLFDCENAYVYQIIRLFTIYTHICTFICKLSTYNI